MKVSLGDSMQKLCPLARRDYAATDSDHFPLSEKYGCVGQRCMAWMWDRPDDQNDFKGYCGLTSHCSSNC
jgi:hypothetical protein